MISAWLISPSLPLMKIHHQGYEGNYGMVINLPVNVNNMVQPQPSCRDDDFSLSVKIKRYLIHNSTYLSGFVRMSAIKGSLRYFGN